MTSNSDENRKKATDMLSSMFRKSADQQSLPLGSVSQEQRLNIRIDSALKEQFEKLCRENHSSVSAELKRFIVNCVKSKSLP